MIWVGIDPGKNGGIAVIRLLNNNIESLLDFWVRPYSDEELLDTIEWVSSTQDGMFCVLEKVGAMPGQGVVSTFNFGQNYGFIQGVLRAHKVPYELVPPQKWKKEFSVTADKNTSILVAKRLFPSINLKRTPRCKIDHDGMAEALLMAEYCRRRL